MTVVRELIAFLGFDLDEKAVDAADKGFNKIKLTALGMAAAVGGAALAVYSFVHAASEAGDEAITNSTKLGITAEQYQKLKFAAQQSGASMEEVGGALRILQQRQAEAAQGNKTFAESFRRAGIQIKDAQGNLRSSVDLFYDAAGSLAATENSSARTALAIRLFGRAGQSLLPFLLEGKEGIEALADRAEFLGIVMSNEDAKAAEGFGDSVDELTGGLAGLARAFGSALIPLAQRLTQRFTELLIANRALIIRGFTVGVRWAERFAEMFIILVDVGERLAQWLASISGALVAFSGIVALGVTPALWGATAALRTFFVTQALSFVPVVLATAVFLAFAAALALLLEDLYRFSSDAPSLLGDIVRGFRDNPITAKDSWIVVLIHDIVEAFEFWRTALHRFVDLAADKGWAEAFKSLLKPISLFIEDLKSEMRNFILSFVPDWLKSFAHRIEETRRWLQLGGQDIRVGDVNIRSRTGAPFTPSSVSPFQVGPSPQPPASSRPRSEIHIHQGGHTFAIQAPIGSDPTDLKELVVAAVDTALAKDRELTLRQLEDSAGVVY